MRILIIHTFYKNVGGGEDVVFNNETEILRQNGHEVEQLVFSNEQIQGTLSKLLFFFKSFYNSRSAKVLRSRISEFKPDVIHVHNTFFVASPSVYLTARKMNIPLVQTLHNYRLICPSATLYYKNQVYTQSVKKLFPIDAILKKVYRNSIIETALVASITAVHKLLGTYKNCIDRFIILNNFSRPIFEKSSLNVSSEKFVLKPNFIGKPDIPVASKMDYFIYVGRLTREKGIITLLKAFEKSNHSLKIYGLGELEKEVEKAAERNENIEYFGFGNREEILNAISESKCLIFPSEWYETFGLTIIEAFSVATPVLSSNIGGHSDLIEAGKTGFHFNSGDSSDLLAQLDKFSNREEVKKMGEEAKKVYLEKYTPEKNYEVLMNIYKSVLK